MEDLQEKLTALLSDEDSMNQLKELAGMIGLPTDEGTEVPSDSGDMAKVMQIMSGINQAKNDDENICFLESLRPLLQEERRSKVDKAVKILRLLNILPTLKDLGGDDFLGLL